MGQVSGKKPYCQKLIKTQSSTYKSVCAKALLWTVRHSTTPSAPKVLLDHPNDWGQLCTCFMQLCLNRLFHTPSNF